MALLWMDGFDKISVDADIVNRGYTVNTTNTHFLSTGGRGGGGAIQVVGSNDTDFNIPFAVTGGNIFHTAGYYKFSTSVPVGTFMKFFNSGRTQWGGLQCVGGGNGTLEGVKWQGFGEYDSATATLLADTYQHIETSIQFSDTGFFKVWVDGVLKINISGDTTFNAGNGADIAWMALMKPSIASTALIVDDLVVWDESGTVFALTQLGKHKIETGSPTGAGTHTDFTPDSGANYARVNEAGAMDGDTSYVESTTAGAKDSYAFTDLASNPAGVWGVQVVSYAKYGTAACDIENMIRSGTTEAVGAQRTLGASYAPNVDFFVKDPATNAAFTQSGVNGLEIGVTKVT